MAELTKMTQKEYASHRGCNFQNISRALKEGRKHLLPGVERFENVGRAWVLFVDITKITKING